MRVLVRIFVALTMGLVMAACAKSEAPAPPLNPPTFVAEGNPPSLNDWGMVQASHGHLVLSDGVSPYDLNTPLFTDYAQKLRTIWMPEGSSADYSEDDIFAFPVGTVITKTFFYQTDARGRVLQIADHDAMYDEAGGLDLSVVRLIETRVLAHRESGWVALTYVWNEEQTQAELKRIGAVMPMELVRADGSIEAFNYVAPTVTQCAACHASDVTARDIRPIGPKARHLNREYAYPEGPANQLAHLAAIGYLRGAPAAEAAPRHAVWTNEAEPLEARARAYLDINCAHCHNPRGPADTSGLYLDPGTPLSSNFGFCKLPVAAGGGTGNRRFDIVPGEPDASVLVYRMGSTNPAEMMPEIGRSTAHLEGLALVRAWIESREGTCQ